MTLNYMLAIVSENGFIFYRLSNSLARYNCICLAFIFLITGHSLGMSQFILDQKENPPLMYICHFTCSALYALRCTVRTHGPS